MKKPNRGIKEGRKPKNRKELSKKEEDEIVKRYLLGKVFGLWLVQTFGKPTPVDANKHYERRLMLRCLQTWQDTHLAERKEWKLDVRAEYHDRYRLWALSFAAWRKFVTINKYRREQLKKADAHAKIVLLNKTFQWLKKYKDYKYALSKKIANADHFYEHSLLRTTWKDWLFHFNNARLMKSLTYISLNHWANRLRQQVFIRWKAKYIEARNLKEQLKLCDVFYAQAISQYKERLKLRTFQQWKKHLIRLQKIKAHEHVILEMGKKFVKRRYFTQWQFYLEGQRLKKEHCILAMEFYQRIEKGKMLRFWKMYTINAKLKTLHIEQANNFRTRKILSVHLKIWMEQHEQQEDYKQLPLFQIADEYYRKQMVVKLMYAWTQFVKDKRLIKQKLAIATNHHNHKILPRYFTNWKEFILIQREQEYSKEVSNKFRREILYAKCFYQWLRLHNMERKSLEMHQEAIIHEEFTITKKYYIVWIRKLEETKFHSDMNVKSNHFLRRQCYSLFFNKWMMAWRNKLESVKNLAIAEAHSNKQLVKQCWKCLKKYHKVCQERKKKEDRAEYHARYCMNKKVLHSWKMYVETRRSIMTLADQKFSVKMHILLSWSFSQWRDCIREQKEESQMIAIAEDFNQRWALKKCFSSLRKYAIWKTDQRFWDDEATARTEIRNSKGLLQCYFQKWKVRTTEKRYENKQLGLACQHYQNKLKLRSIYGFQIYVHNSLKKKVLTAKFIKYYIDKLERKYFAVWQLKFRVRIEEHRKTDIALIWWSFQLQRKVLYGLKEYKDRSLKKKMEYKNALLFRRQLLIEKGLDRWIEFANESMERRRRIAYNQQMKECMALQGRVRRYAMHWIRITQQSRLKRNESTNSAATSHCHTKVSSGNSYSVNINRDSIEVNNTINERFKKFDVNFPKNRTRPIPRRPDYLRESFDLKKLSTFGALSMTSTECQPRIGRQPVPAHAPSVRPSVSTHDTLELSTEDAHYTKSLHLLPPSTFS